MIPGLDVAFVGVTLDSATSNRSGTRYGPRQIRTESVMLRAFNKETGYIPSVIVLLADPWCVFSKLIRI